MENAISAPLDGGLTLVFSACHIGEPEPISQVYAGIKQQALLPGLTDTEFASALVKNEAILNTALQMLLVTRQGFR